jgi:RNA polymerase sigma-70 factor, ECF subfamily
MSAGEGVDADMLFRDQLVALLPPLRAYSRGLCGNWDMADDLAQDTMMRAWAGGTHGADRRSSRGGLI